MDFLEVIQRNVENSVLVCLKVIDVYSQAVFTMETCPGKTTLEHVVTPFVKVNLSSNFLT